MSHGSSFSDDTRLISPPISFHPSDTSPCRHTPVCFHQPSGRAHKADSVLRTTPRGKTQKPKGRDGPYLHLLRFSPTTTNKTRLHFICAITDASSVLQRLSQHMNPVTCFPSKNITSTQSIAHHLNANLLTVIAMVRRSSGARFGYTLTSSQETLDGDRGVSLPSLPTEILQPS